MPCLVLSGDVQVLRHLPKITPLSKQNLYPTKYWRNLDSRTNCSPNLRLFLERSPDYET